MVQKPNNNSPLSTWVSNCEVLFQKQSIPQVPYYHLNSNSNNILPHNIDSYLSYFLSYALCIILSI